jgi:hypothetical protein
MGNAANKKVSRFSLYSLFCVALFIAILLQPISKLYSQGDSFFSRGYSSQYDLFKKAYYGSQYVKKNNPGIMPDQTLESFAAGAFLKGINPILIIHDQPPLGRYMLSLSILLFDNPNTIMVLFFFLSALGVFLIGKSILKDTFLSLIPLGIFINEPIFLNKFYNSPLLEPIQLPFIIFALYFFVQGIINKKYVKWFILTSIMLGFVISIRFFVLGVILVSSMIIYLLLSRQFNKKLIVFLITLSLSVVVLLISYARTIQLGSSILHIFGIQKYIYIYHKQQLSLPFSFWDLLLLNRWHIWWGTRGIISDPQWIIIWPISMILTLFYILLGFIKKILLSEQEKIIIIWIIAYCMFLSFGESSTRYFTPLLPFIYIMAVSFLMKIFLKFKGKI